MQRNLPNVQTPGKKLNTNSYLCADYIRYDSIAIVVIRGISQHGNDKASHVSLLWNSLFTPLLGNGLKRTHDVLINTRQ